MKRIILLMALFAMPTFAAAECKNEWSIEPFLEYNDSKYSAGTSAGVNFVFSFGGSAVAECEAEMANIKSKEAKARYEEARANNEDARRKEQELDNLLLRLEICQEAVAYNAPRLITECHADGLIE